jgi:hypothetical protein
MTDEAYWQILSWATKLAYLAMLDTLVINRSKYIVHQRKIAILFCIALVYVLFLIAIRPVPFMLYQSMVLNVPDHFWCRSSDDETA